MRHAWITGVGIVALVGVIVLSAGLFLMADNARATAPTTIANSNTSSTTSWDKKLPSASRFTVLADFGGAAVRDNETGLVWEQTPDVTDRLWTNAASYCLNKNVGGRKSWRLPSIPELASLVDPTVTPGPTLPLGHPFTNVQSSQAKGYWSATRNATISYLVWHVFFDTGLVTGNANTVTDFVWCVRGPMNADQY